MMLAKLDGILSGNQPHTILAPPDGAFETNLPALYQVDKVADMDQSDIDSLFRYHILKENLPQDGNNQPFRDFLRDLFE